MLKTFSKNWSISFAVLLAILQSSKAEPLDLRMWPNIKVIMTQCISTVHKNMYGSFDAFLDTDGSVQALGTQREWFEFRKCLVEAGVPLASD
jgi:hypothetical protein